MTLTLDFPTWIRVAMGLLGAALVFCCLCRAKHMTHETTVTTIRYATTALAGAGFVLILAAAFRPDWLAGAVVTLAGSTLAVQIASAKGWSEGLPSHFKR